MSKKEDLNLFARKPTKEVQEVPKIEMDQSKVVSVPKPPKQKTPVKTTPKKESFDYDILDMCVNNYLKGYKRAYKRVENDDLSKVKKDYEKVLKEKEKLKKYL